MNNKHRMHEKLLMQKNADATGTTGRGGASHDMHVVSDRERRRWGLQHVREHVATSAQKGEIRPCKTGKEFQL